MRPLKILQLCPLWAPISQNAAGGIETFLAHLTEALTDLACEITVMASGDSKARGELIPVVPKNVYSCMKAGDAEDYSAYEQQQVQLAIALGNRFDVIHSHIGPSAFALSGIANLQDRVVHALHSPVTKDLEWFVGQNPGILFSAVSRFQANKLLRSGAGRCEAIHNGIPLTQFPFEASCSAGLLFLGRIEYEKGPDIAIEAAKALDLPLILAGPIIQQEFFDAAIAPHLNRGIRYVGRVNHEEKIELLRNASCVLMPSRWDEPFGMVAIEAMACGTPVVALNSGAFPEIIKPGLSGYLCDDPQDIPKHVIAARALERSAIRAYVAEHFDIAQVARNYRSMYERIAERNGHSHGA